VGCLVAEALIPTTNGFWSVAGDILGVDQTVAAFAARLKDAVDVDSVRDDLAGVATVLLYRSSATD
jgi:hypothetical protein